MKHIKNIWNAFFDPRLHTWSPMIYLWNSKQNLLGDDPIGSEHSLHFRHILRRLWIICRHLTLPINYSGEVQPLALYKCVPKSMWPPDIWTRRWGRGVTLTETENRSLGLGKIWGQVLNFEHKLDVWGHQNGGIWSWEERTKNDLVIVRVGEGRCSGERGTFQGRWVGREEFSSKLWLMTLGHSLPGNQGPGVGETGEGNRVSHSYNFIASFFLSDDVELWVTWSGDRHEAWHYRSITVLSSTLGIWNKAGSRWVLYM